jgi:hypothetical protein
MHRMSPKRIAQLSAIAATLSLLFIGGCGSDRTSGLVGPEPTDGQPGFVLPSVMAPAGAVLGRGNASGGNSGGPGGSNGTNQQVGSGPDLPSGVQFPSASASINGAVGGTVTCGRFTLTFAPGAFSGVQTITILDTTAPYVECRLLPEGLPFSAPVTLAIDLKGTTGPDSNLSVFWYDPAAPALMPWVDVGGQYNISKKTLTTVLAHFSTYRPGSLGRAGW